METVFVGRRLRKRDTPLWCDCLCATGDGSRCRTESLKIMSLLIPNSLESSRTDMPVVSFNSLINLLRTLLSLHPFRLSWVCPLFLDTYCRI